MNRNPYIDIHIITPPLVIPLHRLRSEEHTSELQSLRHLVCRLLLEKKKNRNHRERGDQSSRLSPHVIELHRSLSAFSFFPRRKTRLQSIRIRSRKPKPKITS